MTPSGLQNALTRLANRRKKTSILGAAGAVAATTANDNPRQVKAVVHNHHPEEEPETEEVEVGIAAVPEEQDVDTAAIEASLAGLVPAGKKVGNVGLAKANNGKLLEE